MTTTQPARASAAAEAAADFLPLKGIDHVEFWVGNAKQAAAYYRALWGFGPVAYAGLETGVRDRASYVMVQNQICFVFTAPLGPEGEVAEHVRKHGDGVHDISFSVDDVESAWRETTSRGAASALEPVAIEGEKGTLRRRMPLSPLSSTGSSAEAAPRDVVSRQADSTSSTVKAMS
jgi:4-hydroxyphenylpyruvate dioxygenase